MSRSEGHARWNRCPAHLSRYGLGNRLVVDVVRVLGAIHGANKATRASDVRIAKPRIKFKREARNHCLTVAVVASYEYLTRGSRMPYERSTAKLARIRMRPNIDRDLDDRVVAPIYRIDHQATHARPGEDRLRHHRAAEQGSHLKPEHGHHRYQTASSACRMTTRDSGEALRARCCDEVGGQRIEHRRANQSREHSGFPQAERQRWKHEVRACHDHGPDIASRDAHRDRAEKAIATIARGRQPAQLNCDAVDQSRPTQ